jgi:hypothetical protein
MHLPLKNISIYFANTFPLEFPESWIIIGKKKPSLPKLYHFLRSGLNGSPSIAYPSMLALLANLPEQVS